MANIAELSKHEVQNPHRRNGRYCNYCRIVQMRGSKPLSKKSQVLQILQNYANERFRTPIAEIADIAELSKWEIENPIVNVANITELSKWEIRSPCQRNCRYCKYCKIMQMRDSEPTLQKSQILQKSQNYPNERFRTLITEIADFANITELCKWEFQNPHCRNRRYCKYHRIMQMTDTEPPSQILQIL